MITFHRRNGGIGVEVVEGTLDVQEDGKGAPVLVDSLFEEVDRL